jgi:hypothetical protein
MCQASALSWRLSHSARKRRVQSFSHARPAYFWRAHLGRFSRALQLLFEFSN